MTPSRPSTPDRPSERVVVEVCAQLGLDVTIVNSRHSIEDATAAADALLAGGAAPTAVFCLSDSIACGVYAAAATRGLAIPGGLSVSGYDNHPVAAVMAPPLTSVEWGMTEVAVQASDLLAAAVSGHPRRGARARLRIAPELVRRASTAAPAA
jgi:LacI family transcriptional regulator